MESSTAIIKVAPTVIFLFKDSDGFSFAVANALHPPPNSSFRRLEESFELPLDQFGIKDVKAKGNFIHFIDTDGNYQVSVLILEKYESPTLVCAITKVLTQIRDASPAIPTLIVPFAGMSSKLKWESKALMQNNAKVSLYGVQIGPETETSRAISTRTQKPPASLQIHYEPLACFLHLVRVLNLPTSILIGKKGHRLSDKAAGEELEILYEMGELLETTISLSLREITWTPASASKMRYLFYFGVYGNSRPGEKISWNVSASNRVSKETYS
ncbi:uncharacterized protein [Euphorbia lathyris]|uniref:uncharacterized protein isoform X2 n=1 Tax=Euphorbia lathyris TaxID=212925 RepID=UPI003313F54F